MYCCLELPIIRHSSIIYYKLQHCTILPAPLSLLPLNPLPIYPQHGADVTRKNRDGHSPLDLVRDSDQDVADLLRGDAALLDAAKKGALARVQRLLDGDNINCRDCQVRWKREMRG